MVDDSAYGIDVTTMLGGRIVRGACVITVFQGPRGNVAEELWLATKGLIVMFGGKEDEVLDPSGGT